MLVNDFEQDLLGLLDPFLRRCRIDYSGLKQLTRCIYHRYLAPCAIRGIEAEHDLATDRRRQE